MGPVGGAAYIRILLVLTGACRLVRPQRPDDSARELPSIVSAVMFGDESVV